MLCAPCALRFAPRRECPRCGDGALHDLTVPAGRAAALAALPRPTTPARAFRALVRAVLAQFSEPVGIMTLYVAATVLAVWTASAVFVIVLLALVFLGVPVNAGLERLAARLERSARRERPRVRPAEVALLAAPGACATFRGRVRARAALPSPLAGAPCVAWRLVGGTPSSAIDDGGGASFEVIADDGRVAEVALGAAVIALAVEAAPRPVEPGPALTEFLAARAVARGEPLRLAEAVLRDGDPVEIEGRAEGAVRPEGYRGTATVQRFRDHPDAPLVIRRGGEAAAAGDPRPDRRVETL